jgi:hypothetical protein
MALYRGTGEHPSLTGTNGLFTAFNENIVSGNVTAEIIMI